MVGVVLDMGSGIDSLKLNCFLKEKFGLTACLPEDDGTVLLLDETLIFFLFFCFELFILYCV